MAYGSNPIPISRRMLALAVIASGGLGLVVGELAGPLAASQARPIAALAPAACGTFAKDVSSALKVLSAVVGDEGQYASFIPQAYKDGEKKDTSAYGKLGTKLESTVKQVESKDTQFDKLESPLLSTEKQCLGT